MDNYDGPLSAQDLQDLAYSLGQNSSDAEKLQNLKNQMQLAQSLRDVTASMPKGTHIPGYMGGVYVAPNALQDAAAATGDVMAAKGSQNAINQAGDIADQQQAARAKMLAAILRSRMGGSQQDPQMQQMSVDQGDFSLPSFMVQSPQDPNSQLQPVQIGAQRW